MDNKHAVNFQNMTTGQLTAFFNRNSEVKIKRFRDHEAAVRRCANLFTQLQASVKAVPKPVAAAAPAVTAKADVRVNKGLTSRPAMASSLKLSRLLVCETTKEMWPNAYRMWQENHDWMTSSQVDRLTRLLYSAAKKGERIRVKINAREFCLVDVQGLPQWKA